MIRPGEPWGAPDATPPDVEITGSDRALAEAAAAAPGALVRFVPDATSDLARAVGLREGSTPADGGLAVPLDALVVTPHGPEGTSAKHDKFLAVNACVLGTAPDRLRWTSPSADVEVLLDGKPWYAGPATTVVVANGQFLRGLDLVPRGHPGDGKAEVQVYALRRGERREMRRRLPTGTHVPHPRIRTRTATSVEVRGSGSRALEVDGVAGSLVSGLRARVISPAFRLRL